LSRKKKSRRKRRERDPDDRIRAILGRGGEEDLPPVDADSLRRFHHHLSSRLSFPFAALYDEPAGFLRVRTIPVLVLRLLPAEEADSDTGLLVEAACGEEMRILPLSEIQMAPGDPGARPIQDYVTWIDEAPGEEEEVPGEGAILVASNIEPRSLLRPLLHLAVYCAGAGATLGAILATVAGAEMAATIGAGIAGLLGVLPGLWYGRIAAPHRPLAVRLMFFGSFGMAAGAMLGAVLGGLAVAFVGAIPGSIAGTLIGRWLTKAGDAARYTWGIAGGFAGGLVYALWLDKNAALDGFGIGLLLGLGGLVLLLLLLTAALTLLHFSSE
jgi:hypothetical protein